MTGPFTRVPEIHRRTVQYISTASTVVLLIIIVVLGLPLRTGAAPLGIVSLQLAASPDLAAQMLDSWASVLRTRALLVHGLDLVLPLAYALAIGTAATRAVAREASVGPSAQIAAGAALVAAAADQVENVAIALTVLITPTWGSVLVTLTSATIKFTTLAVAVGALGVTLQRARSSGVATDERAVA